MTAVPRAVVVIVDPLRAGIKLAQLFNGLGYRCAAVLSEESDSEFWRASFRPQDFLLTLQEAHGFDTLVQALGAHEVACLLPGGESGVDLADRLTPYFPSVPGLNPAMAHGRRDKYFMAELLTARGIAAIPHCRTGDVETALAWYRNRGVSHVVVKPLAGTSAEGVHFCASQRDVRDAFAELLGTVSLFGRRNSELLIQTDISRGGGVEFTVNSVSSRGRHHVTDVWRMRRRMVDTTAVCVYSELVHPDEDEYKVLDAYTRGVLDALGIDNGSAHSEIMLTSGGPVLIETGARIEGACDPGAALTLCGRSQNSLLPQSYLDPCGLRARDRRAPAQPRSVRAPRLSAQPGEGQGHPRTRPGSDPRPAHVLRHGHHAGLRRCPGAHRQPGYLPGQSLPRLAQPGAH